SPAKAKSISKMLGSAYTVKASVGHVRDLPEHSLGVDITHDFAPEYVVLKEKKDVLAELARAAQSADQVIVATDPDREGEAIGWHLAKALELDPDEPIRVTFNEITREVVRESIKRPRPIDQHLVDAQQARRVLDRLVGYQLSPLLSGKFQRRSLSAGRVQSVALRLVVERERAITSFVPQEYWTIEAQLATTAGEAFWALLYRIDGQKAEISNREQAEALLARSQGHKYRVRHIEQKERRRTPAPPFTTSTLQQVAAGRLGLSASKTMSLAQRLYEGVEVGEGGPVGLITYMRTDSVRLSEEAIKDARGYIASLGASYLPEKSNYYRGRKGNQDAHEAIRPTLASRTPEAVRKFLTAEQAKLYDLIWRRFVASQMAPALYHQTVVTVDSDGLEWRSSGSLLLFEGWLKIYPSSDDEDEALGTFPPLVAGQNLELRQLKPEQHFTKPEPRYTEGTLVKALEEAGIGRPSTYAAIIETLFRRKYAVKEGKILKPTALGEEITDFLVQGFPAVLDYQFTADMEDKLDSIEEGNVPWSTIVRQFYDPFTAALDQVPRERCEVCGAPLEVKVSRFGQFLGCTRYPECKFTRPLPRAAVPPKPSEETCQKCGQPMVIREGRFGPFLSCSTYPKCDFTKPLPQQHTGVTCPVCRTGEIVQKRSRRGRTFYSCNRYPDCRFSMWHQPLKEHCERCG
ncbi:MAG: type I DNA topoisomerase, partial [Deinococcus sp.]|nr:type I DNA topoisomerase [Deinococcus sp.]